MKGMKLKESFKHYIFKGKDGKVRRGMQFITFFYCVNDDKEVDLGNLQVMRCLFCYNNPMHALNLNTKERKILITYYKTYGISTLKKHVDNDHAPHFGSSVNTLHKL